MPSAQILERILNVLEGAENLEELRIICDGEPTWESSSLFVHPLCAALSNRKSLRKLYVMEYRLDLLLPVLQFKGLTSLVIIDMELWHSMEVLPSLVEHVAASIEILHLDALQNVPPSPLSRGMAQILCDGALTMPNLRELTTHLMVSPDPMSIFHAISTRCRSLTKLDLYISVESSLDVPLNSLTLPCLRILYLSFEPHAPIVGLWDGQCGLAELDEFRIKGRYLRLEEVDSMCRFFAETTLVSLSIRVFALDGPVLRVLADYLPMLRNLDLFADHLLWLGFSFPKQVMVQTLAQLAVDVQGRGLEGWGLEKLFVSLNYDRILWPQRDQKPEPPQEAVSILARCIPSIRTTDCGYHYIEDPAEIGFLMVTILASPTVPPEIVGEIIANVDDTPTSSTVYPHPKGSSMKPPESAIDSNPENALRVVCLTIRGVRFESSDPYHDLIYKLGALRGAHRARRALPVEPSILERRGGAFGCPKTLSMSTPGATLPPEIWIRISSFLDSREVTRLYGVNRLFYELALERRYSRLALDRYRAFQRTKACLRYTGRKTSTAPDPTQLVRDCILDSLTGAERLQEVAIGGAWSPEYKQYILQPLDAALERHVSIRRLRVESDKLWVVLPFLHFRGLEDVTIQISCHTQPELKPSMGALADFLAHIAPSVRVLALSAPDGCPTIDHVSPAVCADGLTMPELRELSMPITLSTAALDTLSSKFSALTKLNLILCAPASAIAPMAALSNLRLPHLGSLWLAMREHDDTTGVRDGMWDGSCSGLCRLDDVRIYGRHTVPSEVASICRFFRACPSGITRLFLKVVVLDGPLVDMLASSFPHLCELRIHAKYLLQADTVLGHTMHVHLFEEQMRDRRYPEWRLSYAIASLYLPTVSVFVGADQASKEVTTILARGFLLPAMTPAQNPIPAILPELPLEVLSAIINEFDPAKHEDRQTLRSLLFACRKLYLLALRPLYQDISFSQEGYEWDEHPFRHELASLARDAKTNPGLKCTTSFSCILVHNYADSTVSYDQIDGLIGDIAPFLINVRRITISLDICPINALPLQSLPSSAPISHLKLSECSLTCKHLQAFLASRPTLKWLDVSAHEDPPLSERSALVVSALLHLLSLSIDARDIVVFEHPLASLVNIDLCGYDMMALDPPRIVSDMAPFASITACRLSSLRSIDISPVVSSFPHLEYLWVHPEIPKRDITYSALSSTKLKYLRCYSAHTSARTLGRILLDTIKTLLIVDVTTVPMYQTMRMYKPNYHGPVFYESDEWSRWWEHAGRAVELATDPFFDRMGKHSFVDHVVAKMPELLSGILFTVIGELDAMN
ncbi:hypothetical protein EYR40_009188 [Pleurotus pulmonarius]|nr:hypothetical protein EYR40_009188 [Pleurotus pulmonarius]